MAGFAVDVTTLDWMEGQLRTAGDQLRQVSRGLAGASATDLGGAELDRACGDFARSWRHGIDQVADLSGRLGERVGDAARAYRENDAAIAAEAHG